MADKFPYWESNRFLGAFVWMDGTKGAEICPDERVKLSLSRPPPLLPAQPAAATAASAETSAERRKRENDEAWKNFFLVPAKVAQQMRSIKEWAETEAPATARKAEEKVSKWLDDQYRFDLQDIPQTLKSLGMPKAAKMFQKWFAGSLNYSPTAQKSAQEINQDNKPYPSSMIEDKAITMEWVLSFSRAEEAFETLLRNLITQKSKERLQKILAPHKLKYQISVSNICGNQPQVIHREFQFQYASVEGTLSQKFLQYVSMELTNFGIPDELTMILGSFNIYAAVAHAYYDDFGGRTMATITHVYIYAKDGFTFTDDSKVSQYLGHWNRRSVAIVPLKQVSVMAKTVDWIDYPIVTKAGVLYPVKNSDFREWQLAHGRGGDYIIYTDRICKRLAEPIRIFL